jgi:hypothetical protein
LHTLEQAKAARPACGPKLFFTSAKTGAGVSGGICLRRSTRRHALVMGRGSGLRRCARF